MTVTMRLLAAAALLGMLTGCAMPGGWTPNVNADPMQNPSIYQDPADG